jgi:alanyl-tRNA synthetase
MTKNQITTREELIKKYLDFFKAKNHKEIPSSSLVPTNDPTVLFTTAGMHPLVPFLLGQKHPLGKRLVDVQKCIRTGDIDEVGDSVHHTFFEMLGNWSLGDYFKKEAIEMSFEFITKELKIPLERFAVTCFGGDKRVSQIPKDEEASKIWQNLGISKDKIAFLEGGVIESTNNWWGPAGLVGPCGPDTEMFYWIDNREKAPKKFNPEDKRWVEIWNDVLMQYNKNEKGVYEEAKQKNIDTGMGVERTLAVLNGLEDNYQTSVFLPIVKEIEKVSGKKYGKDKTETKNMRIIADHIKASTFIISDGVIPTNTERGYVLRRLIRRAIRYGRLLGVKENFTAKLVKPIAKIYPDYNLNSKQIEEELSKEEERFMKTLESGIKIFEKIANEKKEINCKDAFLLYQSYGFPIEMTKELANEKNIKIDEMGFNKECQIHQELSKTASAGTFKSGLADNTEATTKLHTATHLLNEALKEVLKDKEIKQKGSNITPERLRFDFNFSRKLTEQEIKAVEDWVNNKIKEKAEVKREELPLEKALKSGAQGEFGTKYPEIVSVYTICDKKGCSISKEICTGPHIKNTSELGKFKILKEESSAAGIRRIKAELLDSSKI